MDKNINYETLILVLNKMFNEKIINADWKIKLLHGGTIGDVKLITGMAEKINGKKEPYSVVFKITNKFDRLGDIGSWRREYDLYVSEFDTIFSDSLFWPKCYHTEINDDEVGIWMEYINGISGSGLTLEMLEYAAMELGRFQGKLYSQKKGVLQNITNLSKVDFMKDDYKQWNKHTEEYIYIRSSRCEIPENICRMLINIDTGVETIFDNIEKLPIVFCHRDFWLENILYFNGKIILIDWDTAGWGFLGEDIASLIADDTDIEYMDEYYYKVIPAYYKGLSEYMDISIVDTNYIKEMILIKYGYRLVHRYIYADSIDKKQHQINTLKKIYELNNKK